MSNENWRAKCNGPGTVLIRPGPIVQHSLSVDAATTLRDELTAAIEEAKRLADPFERWVGTLERSHDSWKCGASYYAGGVWMTKPSLRAIYDSIEAARKEQP